MTLLLDHLWQSTLVAALAGLLTLRLDRNGADVRFWLWFAASMKFLAPFALLATLGRFLSALYVLPALPQLADVRPAAEMMLVPAHQLMPTPGAAPMSPMWLLAPWALGVLVLVAVRLLRWRQLCRLLRAARPGGHHGGLALRLSASSMEPGLVGIMRPVVLLPAGLYAQMAPGELEAILAHEAAHYRRQDNLTAALHMLVETIFWFWPVVWFIGARMIAERERACDERVLADGHDPHVYATGILNVCRFCVRVPLACVSGASAAGLAGRVERIALAQMPDMLGPVRRLVLTGLGVLLLAVPLVVGMAPVAEQVRLQAAKVRHGLQEAAVRITAVSLPVLVHASPPAVPHVVRPVPKPLPAVLPMPAAPRLAQAANMPPPAVLPVPQAAPPITRNAMLAAALAHAHMALSPSGDGDPDAVACRVPQYLPGSRFTGPKICKTNRVWAVLRAHALVFSPDGTMLFSTANTVKPRPVIVVGAK